jgi:glycosyltransferase involved in cell wall biosynthesis
MRIAILTNTFPPDGKGGAERIASLQAEGLRKQGHDVRVWASNTRSTGEKEGVTRFASPDLKSMNPLHRLWFHLILDAKPRNDVVGDIFLWKPDALLTHNLTGCGMATPKALQAHGIPWTHTLHDIQLTDPSGQETEEWSKTTVAKAWRAFWSARRRASFGTPDMLVSPTQWLLDWHHRHGFRGKKENVVRNPVEVAGERRDRSLKTPATVIYVGRLSRDKGFDRFLDVIKKLPPSLVDQITINGVGPMAEDVKKLADPRVDLIGAIPPEAVRQIMADADLLVAPSRLLENQQNILLEAMSVGTPIVATDTGGTKETLEGTGCPVVPPDQLAKEVTRILLDFNEWKQISKKMQEKIRKEGIESGSS